MTQQQTPTTTTATGTVVSLWRYPVKSMMGEELNSSYITERGLVGYLHAMKQHEGITSLQHLLQDQTIRSKNKKILLVDDEPDICLVYQMVLEDAGYECITYTDSVKALQDFRPNYYDLILLDIKMPVLNGFEFCKKIRELDRTVHIIFITASEAYYEKFRDQHFPELGKVNYIQKPVGNDELVRLVDTIIANSITMD